MYYMLCVGLSRVRSTDERGERASRSRPERRGKECANESVVSVVERI
jgi:hypothetical protein